MNDEFCRIRFYTFEEFIKLRREIQFKPFWFNREIALNPNGKIYPFGRPNDVNFCIGSAENLKSVRECFDAPEYARMLDILKSFHKKICVACRIKKVCNGVIICMAYMYGNELEMLQHSCRQADSIFQHILQANEEFFQSFDAAKNYNPKIKKFLCN